MEELLTPSNAEIDILLADGHSLFREAVKTVLDSESDLHVVAEASDGLQAIEQALSRQPSVALLDAALPNRDGIRTTAVIKEHLPECRVIVLAEDDDENLLIGAVEAGASGFLTKESPLSELIQATRSVYRGETLIPGHMLGSLLGSLIRRRRKQDDALRLTGRLTRREREVLALLTDGADNDAIAQHLVISPQTARTHIQNILGKLELHSRLEAAAFVRSNGILDDLVRS